MHTVVIHTWSAILAACAMVYAVLNLKFIRPFWRYKDVPYIKHRKYVILMVYGLLASFSLLVIVPNLCASIIMATHGHEQLEPRSHGVWDTHWVVFDSLHESVLCTLINIIASRVWLLYYDYKFAMATVDRVWRKAINPSDQNFFLNHRHSLGKSRFLLKLIFLVSILVASIMVLAESLLHYESLVHYEQPAQAMHNAEFVFFSLKILIGVPALIFIAVIYHKIEAINDQFHIKNEIRFLSYSLSFDIFASLVCVNLLIFGSIPLYEFETISYSLDVFFICSTCYIQSKYVLDLLVKNLDKVEHQKLNIPIKMVEILRHKNSFNLFMRHCVNALCVESLLFLVEVAQYKATLNSNHACDQKSAFFSFNMQTTNLRQILLNHRSHSKKAAEQEDDDDSDPDPDSNAEPPQPALARMEDKDSFPTTDKMVSNSGTIDTFRIFQQSILDRKWLPISMQLRVEKAAPTVMTEAPVITMSNLQHTVIPVTPLDVTPMDATPNNLTVSSRSPAETPATATVTASPNMMVTPISPNTPVWTNHNFDSLPKIRTPQFVGSSSFHSCVTPEDIRESALCLYEKYVKIESALAINIAFETRQFLDDLFSVSSEQMFRFITEHSGGTEDESKQCPAAISQQLLINTYLYHVFDAAFEEIWNLLKKDTFVRFSLTEPYQKLVEARESKQSQPTAKQHMDSFVIVYED